MPENINASMIEDLMRAKMAKLDNMEPFINAIQEGKWEPKNPADRALIADSIKATETAQKLEDTAKQMNADSLLLGDQAISLMFYVHERCASEFAAWEAERDAAALTPEAEEAALDATEP